MSVASAAIGHGEGSAGHVDRPTKLRQFRMLVLLLIVSDVVFVAGLFFAYLYLRALNINNMWLPAAVHPMGAAAGWSVAGLMAASAAVYRWGDLGGRGGRPGQALGLRAAGRRDGGWRCLGGRVDVAVEIEWQRDLRRPEHAGRGHLGHAGNP